MREWTLQTFEINSLTPHEKNPRYLSKEDAKHLKKSIFKFGLIDKPVITHEGKLIGGHQRLEVLKTMGYTEVECWVCDSDNPLTEEEVDELNIRLNKNQGDWDWDILANQWDVNNLCDWGFDPAEFDDLPGKLKKPKITFEFEDADELSEFMDRMNEFPSRESGLWNYKMKVKS